MTQTGRGGKREGRVTCGKGVALFCSFEFDVNLHLSSWCKKIIIIIIIKKNSAQALKRCIHTPSQTCSFFDCERGDGKRSKKVLLLIPRGQRCPVLTEWNDEWQCKQLTNTVWFLKGINVCVQPCDEVLFSFLYVNDNPSPKFCHPGMTLISKFKATTVQSCPS